MADEKGFHFSRLGSDTLQIDLTGRWLMEEQTPGTSEIFQKIDSERYVSTIVFKTASLEQWDSGLLTFLIKLMDHATGKNINVDRSGLPDGVNKLIRLATHRRPAKSEPGVDKSAIDECPTFLDMMGSECEACAESAGDIVTFIGDAFLGLIRVVRGEASFRLRDLKYLIQDAGANTLPIVTLISLLTGMILSFVGAVQLEMFGAQIFIANLVGLGMAREMGALMTGVILAGRTGATYAAEIGSMQVNEEIDALTTLGVSSMEFIALPRMIALVLMTPLLVIYADFLGILGGAIVTATMMDIPTVQFYTQIVSSVDLSDLLAGLIKGSVFGFVVAVVGCLRGFQCGRSSSAVGEATTSAVVTSIVLMVALDALLTIIYSI